MRESDNIFWNETSNIKDLIGTSITDSNGNIIAPGITIDIGCIDRIWRNSVNINLKPEKIINKSRRRIGRILGIE